MKDVRRRVTKLEQEHGKEDGEPVRIVVNWEPEPKEPEDENTVVVTWEDE